MGRPLRAAALVALAGAAVLGDAKSPLQPSAAALERAAAHAKANPNVVEKRMWQWVANNADKVRGHRRWGRTLDAGTGVDSMSWLCAQPTESIVAATAADWMVEKMEKELQPPCRPVKDEGDPNTLLFGNWFKGDKDQPPLKQHPAYTAADGFDTVVADYLLGALEHYAAFNEEQLLDMLIGKMNADGLLLFCGRTPFPYAGPEKTKEIYNEAKQLVLETERVRDAAMLLAHQRPYRGPSLLSLLHRLLSPELELLLLAPAEFPAHWVATALERKGLEIVKREVFAGKMNMNCPSLLCSLLLRCPSLASVNVLNCGECVWDRHQPAAGLGQKRGKEGERYPAEEQPAGAHQGDQQQSRRPPGSDGQPRGEAGRLLLPHCEEIQGCTGEERAVAVAKTHTARALITICA